MLVEHTIDTSNGQHREPNTSHRARPRHRTLSNTFEVQRGDHKCDPHHDPYHDHRTRPRHRTCLWNTPSTPTTASESTQSSASRRAHNLEHRKSQPHRHRKRPPEQPSPRPANPPTTSNTHEVHAIDTDNSHQQSTRRQPHNQPRNSGEGHSGEAGEVTPGRGREQDTKQTNPRPAGTPTTSNTNEAHAINNDDGQQDDLDLGQQPRP